MRNQIMQPFGLTRLGHRRGASAPALEVFDVDENAIVATNIQDANAPNYTATDVANTSTEIVQNINRQFVYSTGVAIGGDIRVRYTGATVGAFSGCGISLFDGANRTTIAVSPYNGRLTIGGTVDQPGLLTTGLTPVIADTTVVLDCVIRPSQNTVVCALSIAGQAPFLFSLTGTVTPSALELYQPSLGTVTHTLETAGVAFGAGEGLSTIDPASMSTALTGYTERTAPTGFTAPIPGGFRFYEQSGDYYTSISLTPPLRETDPEVTTLHVDIATGSDTGAGTSGDPLKSLHVAASRFLPGGKGVIKAKGGLYPYANCFRNYIDGALVQIVSWDGQPVISSMHDDTLSWALHAGNTYVATLTPGVVSTVFDASSPTADGDHKAVERAASVGAVEASAGTWVQTGTSVYVHLFDGRAPDADLRVYTKQVGGSSDTVGLRQVVDGSALFLQDVHFEGGDYPFSTRTTSAAHALDTYARRCSVKYGGQNGLNIYSDGIQVWQECEAAWNTLDGLNYKSSPFGGTAAFAIEIHCDVRRNGRNAGGTNNGSSQHGGPVIRVQTTARDNEDRNIHDIDTGGLQTQSWNMGCDASDPQTADPNFAAGLVGSSDATLMWLDGCTSSGGSFDIQANAGATVYQAGFTGDATNDTNDSGSIATYTP